MTLQVWEQTISESFAGFEGLLQTISCFFAVSDVLDGFFFPHKMIIHVGNEMPQFLPTHFSTKASMETHVCQFYRYYHDRILLLFCQKHMLILKMGMLHHLLSFSFKPLFIIFCSMAIEFFPACITCFLLVSLAFLQASGIHVSNFPLTLEGHVNQTKTEWFVIIQGKNVCRKTMKNVDQHLVLRFFCCHLALKS